MARIESRQTRDFLVHLLWTAVIGIEIFLLLDDITLFRAPKSELPEMTGERIAELRDQVGGVRWQNPKDIVWNEARGGQPLYEGQSLMTLSDSSARLVFDAREDRSTEIEVGAKTLLQLQTKRAGDARPLLLSLARGSLRAKTARALDLAAGEFSVHVAAGSTFEAESVSASASRSGRAAIRLKIIEGGARAGDREIARDQTIEVPVLTPEESAAAPEVVPMLVDATPTTASSPAPYPNGTPSPAAAPTPTPTSAAKATRVRALPPPALQSPILRRRAPAPTPAPRETGASLFNFLFPSAYAEETEEWDIELRWEPVAAARGYRVEISRTRKFEAKIADETTTEAHWTWPYRRGMENSKGRVFYRIATVNERGVAGPFSAPRPFQIPAEINHPKGEGLPPAPIAAVSERSAVPASDVAWSFRPAAELTSLTETSDDAQIRRVAPGGAYVHEALGFSRSTPESVFGGALRTNHFKSETGTLPKTRSFRGTLTFERATAVFGGKFYFGAAALYSDHFVKDGPNGLALDRGLSFGPSAEFAGRLWSASFRLPITGAFGKGIFRGAYGPTLRVERDFPVAGFFLSFSGEGSLHFWESISTSTVAEWSIGLGPKVILR